MTQLSEGTIAGISTAPGEAALAVVRLSGSDALSIVDRCFRAASKETRSMVLSPSHTLHYGHITAPGDQVVDEVMVGLMKAPRSFTREDVVEISCHGGALPARAVLNRLLECGARMAAPGEFTRRAFMNGRIDLTQAEAVMDLIHARTDLAMKAAHNQLGGSLSKKIEEIRAELMRTLAHIEAYIDFPEEDIAPDSTQSMARTIEKALEHIRSLLATAEQGRILREGVRAAIIGRPNAGKSSLLNAVLGCQRAIVSPTPGTTRDTIEESANIRGVPLVFVDTAGLRESSDDIEREGMRRTEAAVDEAEILLHVLDISLPFSPEDARLLERFTRSNRILVLNKADLEPQLVLPPGTIDPQIRVSCVTGQGIDALEDAICEIVFSGKARPNPEMTMINLRHKDALGRAQVALEESLAGLVAGATPELVAADLRIGVNAVGEVSGRTTTEDLLDVIFSQFCIGK